MTEKNREKTADYWYDELESKLPDLKYIARTIGFVEKNIIYTDAESFLSVLLKTISQRLAGRATFLGGTTSQPNSYEQILTYKYLKENNKLSETSKLAERMLMLSLQIDVLSMDSHSKKEDLVALYNKIIKDVFLLETEYLDVLKFTLENIEKKKETKEKDTYIG